MYLYGCIAPSDWHLKYYKAQPQSSKKIAQKVGKKPSISKHANYHKFELKRNDILHQSTGEIISVKLISLMIDKIILIVGTYLTIKEFQWKFIEL